MSEEISSLAEEVDACNLPYSMELVRLVDGVSTYELCINGEVREFGDLDDLYEHVRIAKANAKAEVITKALTAARNAALEEAAKVIANLAATLWQMLDDMGEHGHAVCGATKAAARAAIGRVASPSLEIDYTLAQAEAVFKEIGGEPVMDMEPDELVEPWASAIRALKGEG